MRVGLKVAILSSGKTQRRVAAESGIAEARLSAIVQGWVEPTDEEQRVLAELLGRTAEMLFNEQTV